MNINLDAYCPVCGVLMETPNHLLHAHRLVVAALADEVLLRRAEAAEAEVARLTAEVGAREASLTRELHDLLTIMPDSQTQELIDYVLSLRETRRARDAQQSDRREPEYGAGLAEERRQRQEGDK